MSGGAWFIISWGAAAMALGYVFAFKPDVVERLGERLGQRRNTLTPLRTRLIINRIAGAAMMIVGPTVIVLVLLGVLPPAEP